MDPGVKVAAALSVLVTAVCLACLFWSDPGSLSPPARQPLKLRTDSEPVTTPLQASRNPDLFFPLLSPGTGGSRTPTVLTPSASTSAPPPCDSQCCPIPAHGSSRPRADAEEQASWGTAAGVKMPEIRLPQAGPEEPATRTHTIVDGDSLSELARRYLGSPDRHLEIYQWNSDVLANPEMLPIGQILRIPPRTRSQTNANQVIERPLVPVTAPSNE